VPSPPAPPPVTPVAAAPLPPRGPRPATAFSNVRRTCGSQIQRLPAVPNSATPTAATLTGSMAATSGTSWPAITSASRQRRTPRAVRSRTSGK
jgi:hypothetical protein